MRRDGCILPTTQSVFSGMLKNISRMLLTVVGAVLGLLGALWILQGINVVPVGFMAGHLEYAVLGLVALALGVVLILFANRRGQPAA